MNSEAGISVDRKWRWWLTRTWNEKLPIIIWVMMNPPTADADKSDATINKVCRYSAGWGYGGVLVLNLYAWRSRDQTLIAGVGRSNDWWIRTIFTFAKRRRLKVICAWGVNHVERGQQVHHIARDVGLRLYCLEHAKNGEPKHPLYLRGDLKPVRFR